MDNLLKLISDPNRDTSIGLKIHEAVKELREKHKDSLPKYDLWRDYLKRSDKYKNVCHWVENAHNEHPLTQGNIGKETEDVIKQFPHAQDNVNQIMDLALFYATFSLFFNRKPVVALQYYLPYLELKKENKDKNELFRDTFFDWAINAGFPFENEMMMNYFIFGNVFKEPSSLSSIRHLLILELQERANVHETHEVLEFIFGMVLKEVEEALGREPTIAEFMEKTKNIIRDGFWLNISITNPYENKNDIIKSVSNTIDKRRNETGDFNKLYSDKLSLFSLNRFAYPKSNIRLDELEEYLKAYDLQKEGKKIKEISEQIFPNTKSLSDSDIRQTSRYLAKAKKIIRNVEEGFFPGNYQ